MHARKTARRVSLLAGALIALAALANLLAVAPGVVAEQPTATTTPALPPPPPSPTVLPRPTPSTVIVCPQIAGKVPAAALNAALANPSRVGGYNQPLDPSKNTGPMNPLRVYLSIHAYGKPYHPLFNSLEFKAGCP